MSNQLIAEQSKIAQNFLWKLAERHCELTGENFAEIKKIDEVTDFSFYGDCVVVDAPAMSRGVYNAAMEFATENDMVFKSANACGDSWVLKMGNISNEHLADALKENINIGGSVIDKQAWMANRTYYNSI